MSLDLYAFWRGELKVDRQILQETLHSLGFEATVLHELAGAHGFWPIDIAGCRTGVEVYFYLTVQDMRETYPEITGELEGYDHVVNFCWRGDAAQCGTALALAAALVRLQDAIIYEPQASVWMPLSEAIETAKRMFGEAHRAGYIDRGIEEQT
jgi:hypothetical protein